MKCVICEKDSSMLVLKFNFCTEHGLECMKNYTLCQGDVWDVQPLSISTKRGCWIDIQTELPLTPIAPWCLTKYLVVNAQKQCCAFYEGFIDNQAQWLFDDTQKNEVSHWMPLPELP